MTGRLPVLWLYGTAAVGKSTVGWELFAGWPGPAGFVDIDQLGMCYGPPTPENSAPEPANDPGRHRMKARNLDAVAANFRAAGAGCLVVCGVVDPTHGSSVEPLPHVALSTLRLRADRADLGRRIAARGRPYDDLDEIAAYADTLDRLPGPCLDTTGLDVPEVLRRVRDRIAPWPTPSPEPAETEPAASAFATCDRPGEILWVAGPAASGKSTVGWTVYQRLLAGGRRTAFVDLGQIGFRHPVADGNHRLKAANLAALWRTYAAEGVRRLVMVGPVTAAAVATYTAALPAARITLCRLRATPATLTERVRARGRGESPGFGLAGDLLTGRPAPVLDRIAAEAARESEELEQAQVGDFAIDTDDRTPAELAADIIDRTATLDAGDPRRPSPSTPVTLGVGA